MNTYLLIVFRIHDPVQFTILIIAQPFDESMLPTSETAIMSRITAVL
jgi:hypothetical protein